MTKKLLNVFIIIRYELISGYPIGYPDFFNYILRFRRDLLYNIHINLKGSDRNEYNYYNRKTVRISR